MYRAQLQTASESWSAFLHIL